MRDRVRTLLDTCRTTYAQQAGIRLAAALVRVALRDGCAEAHPVT